MDDAKNVKEQMPKIALQQNVITNKSDRISYHFNHKGAILL